MDDYRKDRGRVTDPLLGAEIGYVIRHECKEREAAQLWDVWQQYCAAQRAYRMRILGTTGEPKGAAIQMVPDAMQADTSMRVDMRSDDERDRQAVSGYMRWKGWLWCLTATERGLIHHAERGTGKVLWGDGEPTREGIATLDALKNLSERTKA
ncbi:hypothetical protein [Sulfitobacter sp. 1A12157]|uniref:hypothetical protein n=1 Tax=Sulfitobacter sp. 1A12157 TaxID=3368594 RepID=UPI003745548A